MHQDKVSAPIIWLWNSSPGTLQEELGDLGSSSPEKAARGDLNFGCPKSHQAPCLSPCWAGSSWRDSEEKTGMSQGHEPIPKFRYSMDTWEEEGSISMGRTVIFPILLVGCGCLCLSSHSSPGVSQKFCSLLPSDPTLWIPWDAAVPGQDYFPWITDSISMRNCCCSSGDKCSCSS